MFRFIDTVLTPDELYRQNKIWKFINDCNKPINSLFDSKIVSILNNSNKLNPIKIGQIYNNLPKLLNDFKFDNKLTMHEKNNILDILNNSSINDLNYFSLPKKIKISNHVSTPKIENEFEFQTSNLSDSSIYKFENLLFDNKIILSYNNGESFSNYLYKNLLNYFDVSKIEDLQENFEDWRIKLIKLIELFKFNNFIIKSLFYFDTVKFNDEVLDVSFIPKYDVNTLNSEYITMNDDFNLQNVKYYDTFDVKNTKIIPSQYRILFKTFPFKNSYYINYKTGQIKHIDFPKYKNESTKFYISEICNINNINYALFSISKLISKRELMSFIIHASNLKHQGLALLVLKIKIGNKWYMENLFKIELPFLNNVVGWCKIECNVNKIILPLKNPYTLRTENYINFIKHIEKVAENKLDVSFLCSSYLIPAYESKAIFDNLVTDCQKYIFCLLLYQEYNTIDLYEFMSNLNPKFNPIEEFDYNSYEHLMKKSPINISKIIKKNKLLDDGNEMFYCSPLNCMEKYRFVDERLNSLVVDPINVELSNIEISRFISLLLNI